MKCLQLPQKHTFFSKSILHLPFTTTYTTTTKSRHLEFTVQRKTELRGSLFYTTQLILVSAQLKKPCQMVQARKILPGGKVYGIAYQPELKILTHKNARKQKFEIRVQYPSVKQ